jgi:hypothetical protein
VISNRLKKKTYKGRQHIKRLLFCIQTRWIVFGFQGETALGGTKYHALYTLLETHQFVGSNMSRNDVNDVFHDVDVVPRDIDVSGEQSV